MKATYFEPQIELVRFDCTDIVASSGESPFATFFWKPLNAASSGQTPTVPTDPGEFDAF